MADRGHELQVSITSRLLAAADVLAAVGSRIYDRVPQNVAFPYLQVTQDLGEPWDAVGFNGWEQVMRVDVWSRDAGETRDAVLVARTVFAALHNQPLVLTEGDLVNGRMLPGGQHVIREEDGRTVHVVQRYRFVTQN